MNTSFVLPLNPHHQNHLLPYDYHWYHCIIRHTVLVRISYNPNIRYKPGYALVEYVHVLRTHEIQWLTCGYSVLVVSHIDATFRQIYQVEVYM